MRIIAILTDFGLKDNFVGVMKGVILNLNPQAKIIDICHNISPHDITEAGFLLASSFSYFPKDTIFLVVVDPTVGSKRSPLAIRTKNYCFIGPDNGVLSLAAKKDGLKEVRFLENKDLFLKNVSSTFQGRDIFAPVAACLSKGISFSSLGRVKKRIVNLNLTLPRIKAKSIEGEIIYIDSFGNLVTNIKKADFGKFLNKKPFQVILKRKSIKKIYNYYAEAEAGEPFLIEGGFGYLEISLKNKNAQEYFSLKRGERPKFTVKKLL